MIASLVLGLVCGAVICTVGWVVLTLSIKGDPKMAMNFIGAGFFIKVVVSGLLCYVIPLCLPEIVRLQFGAMMGMVVALGIPTQAVLLTSREK